MRRTLILPGLRHAHPAVRTVLSEPHAGESEENQPGLRTGKRRIQQYLQGCRGWMDRGTLECRKSVRCKASTHLLQRRTTLVNGSERDTISNPTYRADGANLEARESQLTEAAAV